MPRSLAELRAEAKPRRAPERSYKLCLAQDVVSRVQVLDDEELALKIELGLGDEDAKTGTERVGDPRHARLNEIEAEKAALYTEMRDNEGEVVLRGIPVGDWQRWVNEHPPRIAERDKTGRPILNPVDEHVAYGICNAQALLDDLAKYVATYNGATVTADDYAFLINNAAPGDIKELCRIVVQLHEGPGVRAPKASSTSSSATGTPAAS